MSLRYNRICILRTSAFLTHKLKFNHSFSQNAARAALSMWIYKIENKFTQHHHRGMEKFYFFFYQVGLREDFLKFWNVCRLAMRFNENLIANWGLKCSKLKSRSREQTNTESWLDMMGCLCMSKQAGDKNFQLRVNRLLRLMCIVWDQKVRDNSHHVQLIKLIFAMQLIFVWPECMLCVVMFELCDYEIYTS